MKKREAEFTVYFRHWLKAHPMKSSAFELKQTTSDSLSFSAIQEHQIDALLACKSNQGFLYKISDDSRGTKPYDMIYFNNSDAFIVIKYLKFFVFIDVGVFLKERDSSKRKSLTSVRAKEIATLTVNC